jgi:superfamily II DNA/RNA helicase
MDGIRDAGFVEMTPVQSRSLPMALEGKDVCAQAQTGTGKTAAFLITIFTRILRTGPLPKQKAPIALVLAPTRELCRYTAKVNCSENTPGFALPLFMAGRVLTGRSKCSKAALI